MGDGQAMKRAHTGVGGWEGKMHGQAFLAGETIDAKLWCWEWASCVWGWQEPGGWGVAREGLSGSRPMVAESERPGPVGSGLSPGRWVSVTR